MWSFFPQLNIFASRRIIVLIYQKTTMDVISSPLPVRKHSIWQHRPNNYLILKFVSIWLKFVLQFRYLRIHQSVSNEPKHCRNWECWLAFAMIWIYVTVWPGLLNFRAFIRATSIKMSWRLLIRWKCEKYSFAQDFDHMKIVFKPT